MKNNRAIEPNRIYLFIGILCFLCFGFSSIYGQSAFVSSFNEPSGSNGAVSYTVGQSFTLHASNTAGSTINGIQQPFNIYTLGVNDNSVKIDITVYPNPVSKSLVLNMDTDNHQKSSYALFDLNGVQIFNKIITGAETLIDMSDLNPSSYVLNVINSGKIVKSFKIIKH